MNNDEITKIEMIEIPNLCDCLAAAVHVGLRLHQQDLLAAPLGISYERRKSMSSQSGSPALSQPLNYPKA
jgi:hypothetical protein